VVLKVIRKIEQELRNSAAANVILCAHQLPRHTNPFDTISS